MRVYIAGPMRGIPYYNFDSFDQAAAMLRERGWDVFSPADADRAKGFDPSGLPPDHDWSKPMKGMDLNAVILEDVSELLACDAIWLLPGWERSPGAVSEASVARWAGKRIMSLETEGLSAPDNTGAGKPTNPKDILGSRKLPLHLWPTTATALGCLGFLNGALKYGRANFRAIGVRASVYYDACRRHMDAWFEGEECDPDDGVPHMAAALACLAIIVDAQAAGKLNDDRAYPIDYRAFVDRATEHVPRLQEHHKGRDPVHYTIESPVSRT